jgi:hypothetical protein
MALATSGVAMLEKPPIKKRPVSALSAVAVSPGPQPPRPLASRTAGTKNRYGEVSSRTDVSDSLTSRAATTASGARP